jgi:DNA polymerase III alpha subunit (gram-positive type)
MREHLHTSEEEFPKEYVVIDTEHNTFVERPNERLITEFALLHVKDDKIVDKYSSMIYHKGIDPRRQWKFRHIVNDDMDEFLPITDLKKIMKFKVGDLPIMGFDIRHDLFLLGRTFEEPIQNTYIDTQMLAQKYLKEPKTSLDNLAEKYHLGDSRVHRALDDCYTTLDLYRIIKNKHQESTQFQA